MTVIKDRKPGDFGLRGFYPADAKGQYDMQARLVRVDGRRKIERRTERRPPGPPPMLTVGLAFPAGPTH